LKLCFHFVKQKIAQPRLSHFEIVFQVLCSCQINYTKIPVKAKDLIHT
jgi:hypothetical protein